MFCKPRTTCGRRDEIVVSANWKRSRRPEQSRPLGAQVLAVEKEASAQRLKCGSRKGQKDAQESDRDANKAHVA